MNKNTLEVTKIGWRFDNSYVRLPDMMLSKISPIPVKKPKLIILNHELSKELGLDFSAISDDYIAVSYTHLTLPTNREV